MYRWVNSLGSGTPLIPFMHTPSHTYPLSYPLSYTPSLIDTVVVILNHLSISQHPHNNLRRTLCNPAHLTSFPLPSPPFPSFRCSIETLHSLLISSSPLSLHLHLTFPPSLIFPPPSPSLPFLQVFDRDTAFIAYQFLGVVTKLLFLSTLSDAHISLTQTINVLRLSAEESANATRKTFLRYVFNEGTNGIRFLPSHTTSHIVVVMSHLEYISCVGVFIYIRHHYHRENNPYQL